MPMSPRMKAKKGRFGPGGLAPIVTIASPANGYSVAGAGSPPVAAVTFTGTAFDDLGSPNDISGTIIWSSDLDGALGTGASVTPNLSAGTHVITASATDATGSPANTGTATITVHVI